MKKQEYIRLAKLSLKQRKKTTRTTIISLAFSFIILIPMFVALIGTNFGIQKQVNKYPHLLYSETAMADYRINSEDYHKILEGESGYKKNFSGSLHIDELMQTEAVSKIIFEQYEVSLFSKINIGVTENVVSPSSREYFSVIDIDKTVDYFPKQAIEFYGNIFVEGYDQGFTKNGKKQVIVSEKLLEKYNLTAESVYLKQLNISKQTRCETEIGETIEKDIFVCKDYTVVGIIKSEVSNASGVGSYMASDMFFTSVNVYGQDGVGVLKGIKEGGKNVYPSAEALERYNDEFMALYYPKSREFCDSTFSNTKMFLEGKNFTQTLKASDRVLRIIIDSVHTQSFLPFYNSETFINFEFTYRISNIVSILCIVVGIIMLFCALINLYSSIYHSVQLRSHNLTMLRAIGARDNAIPKLYLTESLIIASKANAFVATIGTGMAIAVKLILDKVLSFQKMPITLTISWSTVFVTIAIAIVFLYFATAVLSFICTRRLIKKKIVDVLNT